MDQNDLGILKGLVSVAWADGKFVDAERDVIEAMLSAFAAPPDIAQQILHFAETRKSLADVPLDELNEKDRRTLLQHAVLLALMDGEFHDKELVLIEELRALLEISPADAQVIVEDAQKRARQLLALM